MDNRRDDVEIIDAYTDANALNDGVLVDISKLRIYFLGRLANRITATLWSDLQAFLFDDDGISHELKLARLLRTKVQRAYFKDGSWTIPPFLWIVTNEVGGWTILYPSEY